MLLHTHIDQRYSNAFLRGFINTYYSDVGL
jgi:hypothetical protein